MRGAVAWRAVPRTEQSTRLPLRQPMALLRGRHRLATSVGAQEFPWATSRRICFARDSSATTRFSRELSFSSSFSRFAWASCRPPYSFRQREYVCSVIAAFLQPAACPCRWPRPRPPAVAASRSAQGYASSSSCPTPFVPGVLSHARWYRKCRSDQCWLALTRKNTDTHDELQLALFSSNDLSEESRQVTAGVRTRPSGNSTPAFTSPRGTNPSCLRSINRLDFYVSKYLRVYTLCLQPGGKLLLNDVAHIERRICLQAGNLDVPV